MVWYIHCDIKFADMIFMINNYDNRLAFPERRDNNFRTEIKLFTPVAS